MKFIISLFSSKNSKNKYSNKISSSRTSTLKASRRTIRTPTDFQFEQQRAPYYYYEDEACKNDYM